MAYTNIASPYILSSESTNFNKNSWTKFREDNPRLSQTQFKVAMEQLKNAGSIDSEKGLMGKDLEAFLSSTPGIGSSRNPLAKFQGTEGNLDKTQYLAAKNAGWTAQRLHDEIGSGISGMTMTADALKQYDIDIAQTDPTWTNIAQTSLTTLNNRAKKLVDAPGVGHTYLSTAGKGGYSGVGTGLKISTKTGINELKRKSWDRVSINSTSTSGKASNSSSMNV